MARRVTMKVNIYLEWLSGKVELYAKATEQRPLTIVIPRPLSEVMPLYQESGPTETPPLNCDYFDLRGRLLCNDDLVYRQRETQ